MPDKATRKELSKISSFFYCKKSEIRRNAMGMKATRHNGRAGKFGAYNVKHNDRNFDVNNSEHIDAKRAKGNVYWDCYQGYSLPGMEDDRKYTFSEIERSFYYDNYHEYVEGQNRRNKEARHTDRHKTIDGLLENTKTCPEETILQLGNIDKTVDAAIFAKIAAEYFEEFQKRYGSHVHILDWALHLDEGTPHIHERHVFDAINRYGEVCPQQEKALEEMGFELPDSTKKKGKYNNRKMTFDAECRKLFLEISARHGLDIDMEPVYGGASYLEKADYIVKKLREENAKLVAENEVLKTTKDELVLKISDVEQLIDEVSATAYEKAVEVVTDTVKLETQRADMETVNDYEKRIMNGGSTQEVKKIVKSVIAGVKKALEMASAKVLISIRKSLADPAVKKDNIESVKSLAHKSVRDKLAAYQQTVMEQKKQGHHVKGKEQSL